mmetsp:Transcript_23623/g.44946  ORF Transcript_23623/g.44946 Transcript_23623/m.44946 type:complete len:200 (-) Transcript_23623:280-879(-)
MSRVPVIIGQRSTIKRRRSPPVIGPSRIPPRGNIDIVSGGPHGRIHLALIHLLPLRTRHIVITPPILPTGITNRQRPPHQIVINLVARTVRYRILHAHGQKRGNVHKTVRASVFRGGGSDVKSLIGGADGDHGLKTGSETHVGKIVHGRRCRRRRWPPSGIREQFSSEHNFIGGHVCVHNVHPLENGRAGSGGHVLRFI